VIGVTAFFRDAEAFNAVQQLIVPELFESKAVMMRRIWMQGCSTGEEAYSLVILMLEHLEQLERVPK